MPKIIDKEEKKSEILKAAMKVFAQKGVADTKMTDISEAAGIGKGTIYEYFKNKSDIFAAAFAQYMDVLETNIAKKIYKITDPVEKLKTLFHAFGEVFYGDSADFIEMMLDFWAEAVRQKDETGMQLVNLEKLYEDFRKMIGAVLEEGIRLGQFKPMNTHIIASLMIGMTDGVLLQWIMNRNIFDIHEAIDCFLNELLTGIYTN